MEDERSDKAQQPRRDGTNHDHEPCESQEQFDHGPIPASQMAAMSMEAQSLFVDLAKLKTGDKGHFPLADLHGGIDTVQSISPAP